MTDDLSASKDVATGSDEECIYNYHRMNMPLHPANCIFCLCSLDLRVASYAASLFLSGYGSYLIFSGGSGKLTESRFTQPEAEVFAARALGMGVPRDRIIVESQSTNTGENVRFTWDLLKTRELHFGSLLLVQKPYMERRTYATFKKQWPDPETEISVSSPPSNWISYPDQDNPKDLVINIMVGDLIRIREYPSKGFQVPQEIPEDVWEAGQRLIAKGFDQHLP